MIGFIGGGNMAEALIRGILRSSSIKPNDIIVSEPRQERRRYLSETYSIKTTASNRETAELSRIIILAVKPQNMDVVLDEIKDLMSTEKVIVSVAAGIRISYIRSRLGTDRIIRVMPNTPALIGEGISVYSLCECFTGTEVNIVKEILMSVGKVISLPEKYMDAVTALSGSGPGFIAYFVEAMIEGGIKAGLPEDVATELTLQTISGTSKLLETGLSPKKLREMVTSPGGTTLAGLNVLNSRDFKGLIAEMILAAKKRAEELASAQ
ncbi:MAG: pyrroline-5-carboxylate reductase [Thermodesulfovibrionales bacterium]|nr:pyrroline-5-carboxylate reductase [Thermodesulfovibrionales bacterium]